MSVYCNAIQGNWLHCCELRQGHDGKHQEQSPATGMPHQWTGNERPRLEKETKR